MDLDLLNTRVNRLLANIGSVVSFLKEYTVDTAKDVSVTHTDDNGAATVKTFPNITKQMGELETWKTDFDIRPLMLKALHVDQTNGDDTNDGTTETAALQSLQKAFDTIPTGGYGRIYITGVYDLGTLQYFTKINKNILVRIGPNAQLRNQVGSNAHANGQTYAIQGNILIEAGSTLSFYVHNHDDGTDSQLTKIYSPANATGYDYQPTHAGMFGFAAGSVGGLAKLVIRTRVGDPNTEIVRIEDGYLFWRRNWDSDRPVSPSLALTGHYTGKYVIGNRLAHFDYCPTMFNVSVPGASFVDLAGNSLDVATLVDGITRDANGLPRSIISNIIL